MKLKKHPEIKLIKATFFNEAKTKQELSTFIKNADILSFSEQCQKFEASFSRYQGRKESIFVNSGSSANLAMIQALINLKRIKPGDAVAFSALTWSTNAMPIIQLGLRPIPIDVELDTLNVSSKTLQHDLERRKIKPKVLFITNLLGFCDDLERIATYCKKNEIILLEDNCESLGSVYQKRKLGNFGLASSFSFYVGHHMSTIEGGMVCTDDPDFAMMLRIVRAHGWDRNLALKEQNRIRTRFKVNSTFYSRYTFYDLGYNLRPTEIAGFLGNNQLQYIDTIIALRSRNFKKFAQKLYNQTKKFYPIRFDHLDLISNFAVPIVCKSMALRERLVKACAGKVEIRPIVGGDMTRQPFFRKHASGYHERKNMNSKLLHEQGLYFGNNPDLTEEEIERIIRLFTEVE